MEQITTSTPSVAMMTVREMAAHAARLTTLTVSADERAEVLNLLRSTCETFAAVAANVATSVVEETPAGATLGTPDLTPPAGRLVMGLSHVGDYLCAARDEFKDAAEACEDLAAEQAREHDRPSAVYATPDAQVLLVELKARLTDAHGGKR